MAVLEVLSRPGRRVRVRVGLPSVRRATVLALLSAALAAFGCGDSNDDDAPSREAGGAPPTKSEYIAQADEICARDRAEFASGLRHGGLRRDARLGRETDQADNSPEYRRAADLLQEGTDNWETQIEELRAITPPAGDKRVIDDWLDAGAQAVAVRARAVDPLRSGDTVTAQEFAERSRSLDTKADGIATRYGFEVCGQADD
jgi:hypothetical protein